MTQVSQPSDRVEVIFDDDNLVATGTAAPRTAPSSTVLVKPREWPLPRSGSGWVMTRDRVGSERGGLVNAFETRVEEDEQGWCVRSLIDGQWRVISRHATEELATAASRVLSHSANLRNDRSEPEMPQSDGASATP